MTTSHVQRLREDSSAAVPLSTKGYAVLRNHVPREAIDAALRHIHLDLIRRGLDAETMGKWLWSADWFPHLKWDPPIVGLVAFLPEDVRDGEQCDPQIVIQPPDDCGEVPLSSHVDQVPDWSNGRPYRQIVGVALSPSRPSNGGLWVWPFDGDDPTPVDLEPGDVLVMHPNLPHASGLNREGTLRYAVYFRFLQRPDP